MAGPVSGYYGPNNLVHYTQSLALGTLAAPTATWATTMTPGTYRVSATWGAYSNHAADSPFTVYDGSTVLGTVLANQVVSPVGFTDSGVKWQDLGTFTITSTNLSVVLKALSATPDGNVVGDAIRVEKVS